MTQTRKEMEVWQACDIIFGEGSALTYKNIGDKLELLNYKRGSASDIKKYLDSWRLERSKKPSETLTSGDPLEAAIKSIRKTIQEEAQSELESVQQSAQQQVEAAQVQIEAAQLSEKLSQAKLEECHTQISFQDDAIKLLNQQLLASERYLSEERSRAAQFQYHFETTKNEAETQISSLTTLFDDKTKTLQQELENFQKMHRDIISELQMAHQNLLDKKMLELDKLRTELQFKEKISLELTTNEKFLKESLSKANTQLDQLNQKSTECEILKAKLLVMTSEVHRLREWKETLLELTQGINRIQTCLLKNKEQTRKEIRQEELLVFS